MDAVKVTQVIETTVDVKVRPEVAAFALEIEKSLRNSRIEEWSGYTSHFLMSELKQAFQGLEESLNCGDGMKVISEWAYDIGKVALIMADNYGVLDGEEILDRVSEKVGSNGCPLPGPHTCGYEVGVDTARETKEIQGKWLV